MKDNSARSIARTIALGALFLVPLTPLVVANSFFFPFITGKAFYFRILVEVMFSAWIILALLDRTYRPRFSWIGVTVVAFVGWMFIADLFAINVSKAFWSNAERMEGWVLLAHFCVFFLVASSVLRAERKWRAWFLASLGVSILLLLYGVLQLAGIFNIHQGTVRIDATFGNSAYFAIYLLFNTFIAGWLAFTEPRPWLRYSLIALAIVEAIFVFFTQTRGTIVGLVGALAFAGFLAALLHAGKPRKYAAGALITIVVVVLGFVAVRDAPFVEQNELLTRLAHISLSDGEARFIIWSMAWQGFLESPVVGWGQEGFNYVFNTYYDPELYPYEQWYDRAHNAFIDWLMAGGLPAFLLYLGLFSTAILALWRSSLPLAERIALTSVLVAYAFHNLFVFDNLYSYIYFFAVLALIDSQVGRPLRTFEEAPVITPVTAGTLVLPIVAALGLGLVFVVNASGIRETALLVDAISPQPGGVKKNLALFEDLTANPSFATQEVREQLVQFSLSVASNTSLPQDFREKVALFAISEAEKQVKRYPLDARSRLQLAIAYRAKPDIAASLKEILAAHELSKRKQQILIQLGVTYVDMNDFANARKAFIAAHELGPRFGDPAIYAASGEFLSGNREAGQSILSTTFGTTTVDNDFLVQVYSHTKDYPSLIALLELRLAKSAGPIESYFNLAAAQYYTGNVRKSIEVLRRALAAHPDKASEIERAIQEVEGR